MKPIHRIGDQVEVFMGGRWFPATVIDLTPNITGEYAIYHLRLTDTILASGTDVRSAPATGKQRAGRLG